MSSYNQYYPPKIHQSASYIIFKDGNQIKAQNGNTEVVDFQGTDASTVIQAAINALGTAGGRIFIKAGIYTLSTTLNILTIGIELIGEGWGDTEGTILNTATDIDVISAKPTSSKKGLILKDFFIDHPSLKTVGIGITLNNLTEVTIENLRIKNQVHGIYSDEVTNIKLSNLFITHSLASGITIDGGGDQYLSNIMINNPAAAPATVGLRIRKSGAFWIRDCDVLNNLLGFLIDPVAGESVSWGFVNGLAVDDVDLTTSNQGYLITQANGGTITGLTFVNCWAGSIKNIGVDITGGSGIRFIGLKSISNKTHGVYIGSARDVWIDDSDIISNDTGDTGNHGISCWAAEGEFHIHNSRIKNGWGITGHQRYGIYVNAGVSNYYSILDNDLRGNETGGLLDGGTGVNKKVRDNLGYVTENSGTATIDATTVTEVVTHGLSITPTLAKIRLTPQDNLNGRDVWVSTATSTEFTINISAVDAVNHIIGWSYEE